MPEESRSPGSRRWSCIRAGIRLGGRRRAAQGCVPGHRSLLRAARSRGRGAGRCASSSAKRTSSMRSTTGAGRSVSHRYRRRAVAKRRPRKPALAAHVERVIARLANVRGPGTSSPPLHRHLEDAIRELERIAASAPRAGAKPGPRSLPGWPRMDDELMTTVIGRRPCPGRAAAGGSREELARRSAAACPRRPRERPSRRRSCVSCAKRRSPDHQLRVAVAIHPGDQVELAIEKPAAGGRMLARHEGRVILVQGGIPGERVRARIGRVERSSRLRRPSTSSTRPPIGASPHRTWPAAAASMPTSATNASAPSRLKWCVTPSCASGGSSRGASTSRPRRKGLSHAGRAARARRPHRFLSRGHTRSVRRGGHDQQLDDRAIDAAARCGQRTGRSWLRSFRVELTENIAATERVLHVIPAEGSDISERAAGRGAGCRPVDWLHGSIGRGSDAHVGDPGGQRSLAVLTGGAATLARCSVTPNPSSRRTATCCPGS